MDSQLSPKFGANSFDGIREKDVYGRLTTDDGGRSMLQAKCYFFIHTDCHSLSTAHLYATFAAEIR